MTKRYGVPDALGVIQDFTTTHITANSNSPALEFDIQGGCPELDIKVKIDAITGSSTPTLNGTVQSWNGSAWVDTSTRLVPITAVGEYYLSVANYIVTGSRLRLAWTVSGTSPDFSGILSAAPKS